MMMKMTTKNPILPCGIGGMIAGWGRRGAGEGED
jgi:hypothetical protein